MSDRRVTDRTSAVQLLEQRQVVEVKIVSGIITKTDRVRGARRPHTTRMIRLVAPRERAGKRLGIELDPIGIDCAPIGPAHRRIHEEAHANPRSLKLANGRGKRVRR